MLYYTILCFMILYFVILYSIILYHVMICCFFNYIILYYIILYYIMLFIDIWIMHISSWFYLSMSQAGLVRRQGEAGFCGPQGSRGRERRWRREFLAISSGFNEDYLSMLLKQHLIATFLIYDSFSGKIGMIAIYVLTLVGLL